MDTRELNDIMSQVTTSHHYLLAQVIIGVAYLWWFYSMVFRRTMGPGGRWQWQLRSAHVNGRLESRSRWNIRKSSQSVQRNPDKFVSRFVTIDETWLHHFDPESKTQSMAWKHVT